MYINIPNSVYTVTFNPLSGSITINGIGQLRDYRLIKIHNQSCNTTLHDKDVQGMVGLITNDIINKRFTVALQKNTSAMSVNDNIIVTIDADPKALIFDALINKLQ